MRPECSTCGADNRRLADTKRRKLDVWVCPKCDGPVPNAKTAA